MFVCLSVSLPPACLFVCRLVGLCDFFFTQFTIAYTVLYTVSVEGEVWHSAAELEARILNPDTKIDLGLVELCRASAAAYLITHQDEEIFGLRIVDAILPSYPDAR